MLEVLQYSGAIADLQYIVEDLADRAGHGTTTRFKDAVEKSYLQLSRMPSIGAPRTFHGPGLNDLGMFLVPKFETYLIFYRITETAVEIVRVLQGARNLTQILSETQE